MGWPGERSKLKIKTMFIIVWRNNHRDPHLQCDDRYFLETFSTYEEAEKYAKENQDSPDDRDYFHNYQIYEEAKP